MPTSYPEAFGALSAVLADHPLGAPEDAVLKAAKAAYDCAAACSACADACLGENGLKAMRACIRLNLDCADICLTTARMLTRRTASETTALASVLAACAEACHLCAEACAAHDHPHCQACAEACQACAQACRDANPSAAPSGGI